MPDDSIATLLLNRPEKRNALSPEVLQGLIDRCTTLAADPSIRVVVLRGEGPDFCAGADLGRFLPALTGPDREQQADLGRRAAEAIENLPQATLARVQGNCVGGGVVLAAACDLVVASQSARFRVPEVALGIPLAWGGTTRLVHACGPKITADLVLTARWFDAEEARTIGLISRVVTEEALDAEVQSTALALADRARLPVRTTKAQIRRALSGHPDDPADADALLEALSDPECMAAAQRGFAGRWKGS